MDRDLEQCTDLGNAWWLALQEWAGEEGGLAWLFMCSSCEFEHDAAAAAAAAAARGALEIGTDKRAEAGQQKSQGR